MSLPVIPNSSANPMNFTENQQGNAVLEKLRHQRETGRFCDVVLVVHGKHFPAHRNILAACSPYFDSILKMHKVVKEQVTVNCQNAFVFELLLNYMYTGTVVIDRNNVAELLKLSNNFLVSKLKNYCAEYLDRYLDATNCITVKELGEKYNMPGLVKTARLHLESNINQVLTESSEVLEFPYSKVEDMLADQTLRILPATRFRFAVRWVSYHLTERESFFRDLLSYVDFAVLIHNGGLAQMLDNDPLFQRSENCLFAVFQVLNNQKLLPTKYESLFHSLLVKNSGDVSIYLNPTTAVANTSEIVAPEPIPKIIPLVPSVSPKLPLESAPVSQPIKTCIRIKQEPGTYLTPTTATGGLSSPDYSSDFPSATGSDSEETSSVAWPAEASDVESAVGGANSNNIPSTGASGHVAVVPPLKIRLNLGECSIRKVAVPKKLYKKQHYLSHANTGHKKPGRPPKYKPGMVNNAAGNGNITNHPVVENNDVGEASTNSGTIVDVVGPSSNEIPVAEDGGNNEDEEDDEEDLDVSVDDSLTMDEPSENGATAELTEGPKAEVLFKCPHCVYMSSCQSRIQAHIEKAHCKNKTYYCNVCHFSCKWNREYYMHMKIHFQGPPFQCDSCDYAADRIQMLLTHRMKHTDERPYECQDCDYRCRTKTNLVAHMRSHTGEKPFTCPECNRGFAIKSTLDQHLATHSDERPFVCDKCPFSTKYQSHLISHKRIHTGDVFRCQFPDCQYTSPKKSQLAAHMRTHMAIRAHSCKTCGRAFIEKSHLVRHERIHLQVKPFKCDYCDYASSRRDKLKEHTQKHHGPNATVRGSSTRARFPRRVAGARSGGGSRPGNMLFRQGKHSSAVHDGFRHSGVGVGLGPAISVFPSGSPPLNLDVALLATDSPTKDVLLSTHALLSSAQTPTPFMLADDSSPPGSSNSLLSDPLPSASTPIGDPMLQRPMSLPPLGAQTGWGGSQGDLNNITSFMAMF